MAIELAKRKAASRSPQGEVTFRFSTEERPGLLARLRDYKPFQSQKVSLNDLIFFTEELALLLETGSALVPSIGSLAMQAESPVLKKVLEAVHYRLEGGVDLSESLRQHPEVFDNLFVSLVRAGESSGALRESLERIQSILEVRRDLRSSIREASTYPAVLLVIMSLVVVFMLSHVVPRFKTIFDGLGDQLPITTRIILGSTDFLRSSWWFLAPILVALVLGTRWLWRRESVRRVRDRLKTSAPVMGALYSQAYFFQLFSTLGLLLGSRVPLLEAIGIAREVVGNMQFHAFFDRLEATVEGGHGVAVVFRESKLFPESVKLMIATGEVSGALDVVMSRLAHHYRQELVRGIRRLSLLIEPVMLVFMGILVGIIAISFIIPIFRLSRAVH